MYKSVIQPPVEGYIINYYQHQQPNLRIFSTVLLVGFTESKSRDHLM
jgi:hypothetical protein